MSSKVEQLAERYEQFCKLPWERSLAGAQRVWFAVYDPRDERRLRARISEFELATQRAGHTWRSVDVTDAFAEWMVTQPYLENYFQHPDDLSMLLPDFEAYVVDQITQALNHPETDENTVVAIQGVASLFGFARVSGVIDKLSPAIRGRLLVFFPGTHEGNNYRLLDARDGWNYLAIPITAE